MQVIVWSFLNSSEKLRYRTHFDDYLSGLIELNMYFINKFRWRKKDIHFYLRQN